MIRRIEMKRIALKRIFAALVAAALIGTAALSDTAGLFDISINASAAESNSENVTAISGYCGPEVSYKLQDDGTLVISGTGVMNNYKRTESPFYNNDNVKKVIIEAGITNVGESMFLNCSKLESVEIADTVKRLEWNSFYGCCSLTEMELPEGLKVIGQDAFDGCSNLKHIVIPDSVEEIGEEAFYACFSLSDLKLPANLKTIGLCSFRFCNSLTRVEIPEGVTDIDVGTFISCEKLESIVLPKNLKTIGDSAFLDCPVLSDITIPDGVVSIGNNAFRECKAISGLTIPDSVVKLGNRAFSYCTSLESVTVGSGIKAIPDKTFLGCSNLKNAALGKNITNIGNNAFDSCVQLESIDIPEGVTAIKNGAFISCKNLHSVSLPKSLESIGERAFFDCQSIISIDIPENVASIDSSAFWNCSSLVNIFTNVNNNSFASSKGVLFNKSKNKILCYGAGRENTDYTIPSTVKSIGKGAFYGCVYLQNITIPDTVKTIGRSAFYNCGKLKKAKIGSNVSSLGDSVFCGCSQLTDVNIPEGITLITFAMFRGCSSLEKVKLPVSVTMIDNFAFYGCTSLRGITIPENCKSICNFVFYDCVSMKKITVPKTVIAMGYGCLGYYYDKDAGKDMKDDNFIMYGEADSMAEKFAKESDLNFELIDVSGLTLNQDEMLLDAGRTMQLKAYLSGVELLSGNVYWSSNNNDVASVSSAGKVTAKSAGTATITAKTESGKRAVCIVTVSQPKITVTGISFDKTITTIEKGSTETLIAAIEPSYAKDVTVTWTSSNNNVAAVSDGKVTAISAGTAAITAVTANGKAASCVVIVHDPIVQAEGISLNKTCAFIRKGTKLRLKAAVLPENTTDKTVSWTTSDRSIATVSNGSVTAQSPGKVTITATTKNGKSASCTVTVVKEIVEAESVSLNRQYINIVKGTKFQLKSIFTPADTTDQTVTWMTSDRDIATVSNGRVTAQSVGTAVVTAVTSSGKSASCRVNVVNKIVEAESVSMNRESISIKKGTKFQLKSIFTPVDTTDQTVSWTTSDRSIATVSNGRVTAQSVGTAVITVETVNGKKAVCEVTVY